MLTFETGESGYEPRTNPLAMGKQHKLSRVKQQTLQPWA